MRIAWLHWTNPDRGEAKESSPPSRCRVSFAFVHHANQYLICNGYESRPGISDVIGSGSSRTGLAAVLRAHARHEIPLNLHISGTLLEAIAWHRPEFLGFVKELHAAGLLELVGSCYGQNVMRFFSYQHNRAQLNEHLLLYEKLLGISADEVHVFWPPERVWDTDAMAPVLTDVSLLNHGYRAVLIDDRVFLSAKGEPPARSEFDSSLPFDRRLHRVRPIADGGGLLAIPISTVLRRGIPPVGEQQRQVLWSTLRSAYEALQDGDSFHLVYADDMEKAAGAGWDAENPDRFEALLKEIHETPWIETSRLSFLLSQAEVNSVVLEPGTYEELAVQFGAGENYERWYCAEAWKPYRKCFGVAEQRLEICERANGDRALVELGKKHLLACAWETAWHTTPTGAHGNPGSGTTPSGWAKTVASHSRHSGVIAAAAFHMTHKDGRASVYREDLDDDGDEEIVLRNDYLFGVFSSAAGSRLLYLFDLGGDCGQMVIGNPTDDWNFQEELNGWMRTPANHPGALADMKFEADRYEASLAQEDNAAMLVLRNVEEKSLARGLSKEIVLEKASHRLAVRYKLPPSLPVVDIHFGLSPNYLQLLREGKSRLVAIDEDRLRGWRVGNTAVWIELGSDGLIWNKPVLHGVGHAELLRVTAAQPEFTLFIGNRHRTAIKLPL